MGVGFWGGGSKDREPERVPIICFNGGSRNAGGNECSTRDLLFHAKAYRKSHVQSGAGVLCTRDAYDSEYSGGARSANFIFLTIRALSEFDSPRKLQIWISTVCARTITCGT